MELISKDILSFIPQRPPFVMVDKLLYSGEQTTRSSFTVRAGNIFVSEGVFKEPGMLENIAQTAAARAGHTACAEKKPIRVGYIGAVKNLQVFGYPAVGSELITEISMVNQVFDVSVITGKVTCNEKVLAQCEMKIFITNQ